MMRTVVRLWCHEAARTYYDRITTQEDESWFGGQLEEIVERCFCTGDEKHRTVSPLGNPESTQLSVDSGSPDFGLYLSPLPGCGSLPPTPCSFLSSTPEGDEALALGGLSSGDRGSTTETERDCDSEKDITSTTPSSSPGSLTFDANPTEDQRAIDTTATSTTQDPNSIRLPTPPNITTHQPTPPSQSSQPAAKTLTPAIRDGGGLTRRRDGEARVGGGGTEGQRRRGVTFQLGPPADSKVERYHGPLLSMNQVQQPGENLCDIIFTKYISSGQKEGERGYVECSSSQLFDGLQRCLIQYNNVAAHKMDLVFFREATRHTAHLIRVFASPGANAFLIGLSYGMARTPLVRLSAYAARCKLFECRAVPGGQRNGSPLRDQIRRASHVAGLLGKPAVLLVRGSYGDGMSLEDVCAVMTEGTCPDLYSKEDLDHIASQMLPGAKAAGSHRNQRLEMALERFYRKVLANLHVVVCMDCNDGSIGSLRGLLNRYPALLNGCSCVDVYRPWNHEALVCVAEQWLRVPTVDGYTQKTYRIPWSKHRASSQLTSISHAMAYAHRSAMEASAKIQRQRQPFKFFSPLTYLEMIDLFKNLASKISKEEKATVLKYERALDALNEAFEAINGFNRELDRLKPLRSQAQDTADLRLEEVEECKAIYAEAKSMCHQDEEEIAKMQEPLLDIKKQTQDELDKVNPVYDAAWYALKSLNSADLDELRTYREPPQAVVKVVNALCLMFREPYDWPSSKALINRANFFQDLEFYNKTAIPDDIYHKLDVLFIHDPAFTPATIQLSSRAASSLCRWVHAIHAYATIHRNMRPKLQHVEEAEGRLQEAQGHLGDKRVKAQDVKVQLEEKVKQYKEAMRIVRGLDKSITNVEGKIDRAEALMVSMAPQHATWKAKLYRAQSNIKTAPGDALLAAASACYHGPLDQASREVLLADWLDRSRTGRFSPAGSGAVREEARSCSTEQGLHLDSGLLDNAPAESHAGDRLPFAPANSRLSGVSSADTAEQLHPITVREDFTVEAILSDPEELTSWRRSSRDVPGDAPSTHNALFMRACCIGRRRQWPLLVDPDDLAVTWVKLLQERGMVSYHEGLALEEGFETTAALSIADINALNSLSDNGSLGRDTPTTKPTSRATLSTDEWDSDYPETPRTLNSTGGDTVNSSNLRSSCNLHEVVDYDPSGGATLQDEPPAYLESLSEGVDQGGVDRSVADEGDDVDKPLDNLWVVQADSPALTTRLVQAMLLGVAVVVTHLERRAMGPQLAELVGRNVRCRGDGSKGRVLLIGGREYGYRPGFCLYLCTSVPLELAGCSGFAQLPIEDTAVIDLATSPRALTARLLRHIMSVERREYSGQWRSIEGDIHSLEATLQQAEDDILDKTLALPHSLLEEASMAEALARYQQVTQSTQSSLGETHSLAEQLLRKQEPYIMVARRGSLLYAVIRRMPALHPLYHVPLETFAGWFRTAVEQARQKRNIGAAAAEARAAELAGAVTAAVHREFAGGLFRRHSRLFAFLVAVAMMREDGEVTEREWLCFAGGACVDVTTESDGEGGERPYWMTASMWSASNYLESEFSIFGGLKTSLLTHSKQWEEYFQHDPVLLAPVPGSSLAPLTFMQKALLWRVLKPDKIPSLCRDLTICQLGSHIAGPARPSIEDVLALCDNRTPVVFLLPADYPSHDDSSSGSGCEGHVDTHPFADLKQHRNRTALQSGLHVVSLGTEQQTARAADRLRECTKSGRWLAIDNFDLITDEADGLAALLQKLITGKHKPKPAPSRPLSSTKSGRQSSVKSERLSSIRSSRPSYGDTPPTDPGLPPPSGDDVHDDFRLFVCTRADRCSTMPGLIVQHGVKVVCESTVSYRESLRCAFNDGITVMGAANPPIASDAARTTTELVMCVALVHTVLSMRRQFYRIGFSKDYQWCHRDLLTSLDMLQSLQPLDIHAGLHNVRQLVGGVVYGGRVDVAADRDIVQALVDSLVANWQEVQPSPTSAGVRSLLSALVVPGSHGHGRRSRTGSGFIRRIQRVFDTMKDGAVGPAQLGLVSGTPGIVEAREGRHISSVLQTLERTPAPRATPPLDSCPSPTAARLELLCQHLDSLPAVERLPTSTVGTLNYLETFLSDEAEGLDGAIGELRADAALLLRAARGLTSTTPRAGAGLDAIRRGVVPASWLAIAAGGDGYVAGDVDPFEWTRGLRRRGELLGRYLGDGVGWYELSAFANPKMFIRSVLREYARTEYVEVHSVTMTTQMTNLTDPPSAPPAVGVYVTGLLLHNAAWSTDRGTMVLPQPPDPSLTVTDTPTRLPAVWLKPVEASPAADRMVDQQRYECPVYVQGSEVKVPVDGNDPVTHVSMPSSLEPSVWVQKRVFITPS